MQAKMNIAVVGGLLLALAAAVPVLAAPAEEVPQAEPRRPDPNERICRSTKVTGSHMRQRVCFTRRQWDQMQEESQRSMRNARPDFEDTQGPR